MISPRRATRRKDPNFYKPTYLIHQVTHIPCFTKQHTILNVLRLHLPLCFFCRGRAPHPCHTIFIVFLILPLPTQTVHWHERWTLPLRWEKRHRFTQKHTQSKFQKTWYKLFVVYATISANRSAAGHIQKVMLFLKFSLLFISKCDYGYRCHWVLVFCL